MQGGLGVSQNFETAIKWFKLAAEQEVARAQFNLGLLYYDGLGVLQDDKTAIKWFKLAAEQGDSSSQFNLGTLYYKSFQDDIRAHLWWSISALNGDKRATRNKDWIEGQMSSSQLVAAKQLVRECVQKNYKGC